MSLQLINYFQLIRLREYVQQHQEFKEAVFNNPIRIGFLLLARSAWRPVRHLLRRRDFARRTAACRPPENFEKISRFVVGEATPPSPNSLKFFPVASAPNGVENSTLAFSSENERIIFIHAYYQREAEMIFDRLAEYHDYDLLLTTSVPAIRDIFCSRFDSRRAACVEVPNYGRDVYPFLLSLGLLTLKKYKFFVKVHTKRSTHVNDGGRWFRLNLDFLLGAPAINNALFSLMDPERPCLYGVESRPVKDHWENNHLWLEALSNSSYEGTLATFIPGTMFMGTGIFLQRLFDRRLDLYPMEAEEGQLDGTLAHALERFFGQIAIDEGGTCLSIEQFLQTEGAR